MRESSQVILRFFASSSAINCFQRTRTGSLNSSVAGANLWRVSASQTAKLGRCAAGARLGVRIICGVELTAQLGEHQMHLVSYLPGLPTDELAGRLVHLKAARVDRAKAIIARLRALGVQITYDEVAARAPGVVARPHIADTLVAAGVVANRAEAFDRYLADGMPAYVPGGGLDAGEAIALVHGDGGSVCLAHPGTLCRRTRCAMR